MKAPDYDKIFRSSPEMAAHAKAKFAIAVDHLKANGWASGAMLELADRYARSYAEFEVLYPEAAEEGPTKTGPNGGMFYNFKWSAVEKLSDRISKFESRMKMDPEGAPRAPQQERSAADEYLD